MIVERKNAPPFISFGFALTSKEIAAGHPVDVWLETIYNRDSYTFHLVSDEAAVTAISEGHYQLTYPNPGVYSIEMEINSKGNRAQLTSNPLTVTVI